MATFNQLARRCRRPNLRRFTRTPKLDGHPQRLGICLRVGTISPKKPNSAVRKIAKVRLPAVGHNVRTVIPGEGHDLQEHNTVLVRPGRSRDIPGCHVKIIRNKHDLGPPFGFDRQNRRSKFGVANWVYLVRSRKGEPLQVVSRVRRRRQAIQTEWGLPLTWEKKMARIVAPPQEEE